MVPHNNGIWVILALLLAVSQIPQQLLTQYRALIAQRWLSVSVLCCVMLKIASSSLLFLYFLLALKCHDSLGAVDPWTSAFREFALNTKETVQKFFTQLGLVAPAAVGQQPRGPIAFQVDPSNAPSLPLMPPPCPLCRQMSAAPNVLAGQWQLALMSRSFRLNTFSMLDTLIARTRAGLPFSERRSFQELIADAPEPICPKLTVLETSADEGKWELAYRLPDGRANSIIGQLDWLPFDGRSSFLWRVGTFRLAHFCIALASFANISANFNDGQYPTSNSTSVSPPLSTQQLDTSYQQQRAFVLLVQVDGWPRCQSFVALTRGFDHATVNELRDLVERGQHPSGGMGMEDSLNRLERIRCEEEVPPSVLT